MTYAIQGLSRWAIPILLLGITTLGLSRRVSIYESFVEGAKEGWQTAVRVLPYLVGMLVAIQIFQQSGALDQIINFLSPITNWLGFPREVLPLALMRPISGSGSLGILSQTLATFGADSLIGRLAATLMGSSETTLYVLTVYAGSVGLKRTRHTLAASLLSDLAGALAALYIVLHYFG
jgi:spore maturation protein B